MFTLVIDRRDVSLDYEGQCLLVRHPQLPTRSVPMPQLRKIICLHGVALHTRVVGQCQRFGIDFVVLNNRNSDYSFAVHAAHQHQAARRLAQYRLAQAPELALPCARRLVEMKLHHCMRALRGEDAAELRAYLRLQRSSVPACQTGQSLRGLEGSAQRQLFEHWRKLLPATLGFVRRQRRPPPDPVNAVLSLTYSLVYHEAIRQCLAQGLDPWLGIYHRPAHGRQSLACDLMEPLRPHVERWVVGLFQEKFLEARHFSQTAGHCIFGKVGREQYYGRWYTMQAGWGRQLRLHAALLARYLDTLPAAASTALAA